MRELLRSWGRESLSNRFHCIGHDENIPSMDIDDDRGFWHCFSGRGGKIGKLISYYYEVTHGMKDEIEALERYLQDTPELKTSLGFSTLRQTSFQVTQETLQTIREKAEQSLLANCNLSEIKLKDVPKKDCKDINKILKYVINLQSGFNNPAVIKKIGGY